MIGADIIHTMMRMLRTIAWLVVWGACVRESAAQRPLPPVFQPEVRSIPATDQPPLPTIAVPAFPEPLTVLHPQAAEGERAISLDECLRQALANTDVVRLLSNVGSARAAVTIYDPAIATAAIDRQQAPFDPRLSITQAWRRFESPSAVPDPVDPTRSRIVGNRIDDYNFFLDLQQKNLAGGVGGLRTGVNPRRFPGTLLPLNPQSRSNVELHYTQPLLQGAGWAVNRAPIVLARIDTERSYFQLKDAVQEMVRGVIAAYWDVVAARVDVFARRKQVEQAEAAMDYTQARKRAGFGDLADVAQARLALANFRAALVVAEANLLDREAALRAILRMPPAGDVRLVPTTPPQEQHIRFDWERLVSVAEERRPDIVELKLVLEADRQRLIQARNQTLPRVDAVALYRWNGLEGFMPVGDRLTAKAGRHTDWTLGVNFSVPLTLRRERAGLRQQELVIMKDRAFLQQAIHNMTHVMASVVRRIESAYAQYEAFRETREAAELNLRVQAAEFKAGRTILLNVLQAIADFGNALSSEARALAAYNLELANLERETGTILETHDIRFFEERFRSLGPLVRLSNGRTYPESLRPTEPTSRYPDGKLPLDRKYEQQYPVPNAIRQRPPRPEPLPSPRPAP